MSKPDDIPLDVWTAAMAAQDEAIAFCARNHLAVSAYPFTSGLAKDALDRSLASAILAERERCAEIADRLRQTEASGDPMFTAGTSIAAGKIAAAIRQGLNPPKGTPT